MRKKTKQKTRFQFSFSTRACPYCDYRMSLDQFNKIINSEGLRICPGCAGRFIYDFVYIRARKRRENETKNAL